MILKSALVLIFVSVVIGAGVARPQQSSPTTSVPAPGAASVKHIVLPEFPPDIPAGPHVDIFANNCLICHTARYVLMQPNFSKTVWQNEVKKMVQAYGATISERDEALIVEYLVAIRGAKGE